jgi:hypothetical protein
MAIEQVTKSVAGSAIQDGFLFRQGLNLENVLDVTGFAFVKAFFFGLFPSGIVCACSYLIAALLFGYERSETLIITMFAAFGFFLGLFTAASRVSVMGVALPLIISFITGYVAYSFKTDVGLLNQKIVPAAIIALIVAATFGAFFGGEVRGQSETLDGSVAKISSSP